jgi:trehalose utilization protein
MGKVFHFQPGHVTCPSYYNEYVQKIIINAVKWAAPAEEYTCRYPSECPYFEKLV